MSDAPILVADSVPDSSRPSLEQLDTLARVTSIHAWVILVTLFLVCVAAVTFATIYTVPIKVSGEGILLIEKDALTQIRAAATGRLLTLKVKPGDAVAPGDEIGRISQDELVDAIYEAESKLADLKREDHELLALEQKEQETQGAAIAKLKEAVSAAHESSAEKLKLARKMSSATDKLRSMNHVNDTELLESRDKLYDIQDDLNKGQSQLAEIELDAIKSENGRQRARLEREHRIREKDTKLKLDREKLVRTARIVSHVQGSVAEVLSARDELVKEGAPVVLVHAPRSEQETEGPGAAYEAVVFVPAGEGKKVEIGHAVEVSPATVKREEHGFIRGRVVGVSELPATRLAMDAALAHPELVDTFLKRYAPGVLLRVQIKLEERAAADSGAPARRGIARANRFRWSSASGPEQALKTGTMCQAAIIVKKRRLINLILPWTKTLLGAD
jgi:HlyD family secretion protein